MEKSSLTKTPRVESIRIVMGSELSDVARAKNGLNPNDMVEIRVERNSPAETSVTKLTESPGKRFANALKKEGFAGKKFA